MLDHITIAVGSASRDYRARLTNAPKVSDTFTTITVRDTYLQDGSPGRLVLIATDQLAEAEHHYARGHYQVELVDTAITERDIHRVIFERINADKAPLLAALKLVTTTPHIADYLDKHAPKVLAQCAMAIVYAEANLT